VSPEEAVVARREKEEKEKGAKVKGVKEMEEVLGGWE
jgi:hypothetical protein